VNGGDITSTTTLNVNASGTSSTSIGNGTGIVTITGGGIVLNTSLLQRTAAGTTSYNLVDGANTTLALINTGAGVANFSVDGSITTAGNLAVNGGTVSSTA